MLQEINDRLGVCVPRRCMEVQTKSSSDSNDYIVSLYPLINNFYRS